MRDPSQRFGKMIGTRKRSRRGVATIEMAVCFPLLVLVCLGTIEVCSAVYLRQSLTIAAYEGARTANALGATTADVLATCQQILDDRGVKDITISTTPSEISSVTSGNYFSVDCQAPTSSNSVVLGSVFDSSVQISGRAEFMKKY